MGRIISGKTSEEPERPGAEGIDVPYKQGREETGPASIGDNVRVATGAVPPTSGDVNRQSGVPGSRANDFRLLTDSTWQGLLSFV